MDIDWQKAILSTDATLQEAISNLNETGFQIVMVVSIDGKFIGTVTDGDIRRGLLRNLDLNSSIDHVINKAALITPPHVHRDVILNLLKINKIHQLPIVDAERRVVGLHLLDELCVVSNRSNLMVIMAGGLGKRLLPHTEHCPKPLLTVAGKPMLEHIVERAKSEGFGHFVLAIRHLGHMIEDYFKDGGLWQVKIEYLREKMAMGTAGGLSLLCSKPTEPFLVSNGDILTEVQYAELLDFHLQYDAVATMVVRRHEWQHPFGVVQTKGIQLTGFEEKPISITYVNAGVYVLDPIALDYLSASEACDMPILFERLRNAGLRTIVYPIHESWMDIGIPTDFYRAQEEILI